MKGVIHIEVELDEPGYEIDLLKFHQVTVDELRRQGYKVTSERFSLSEYARKPISDHSEELEVDQSDQLADPPDDDRLPF